MNVGHSLVVEHLTAKLKFVGSSPIRGNAFTEIFQVFLMTGQEKCGKFECGQNQRRQLLEQFNKVERSLILPVFQVWPCQPFLFTLANEKCTFDC